MIKHGNFTVTTTAQSVLTNIRDESYRSSSTVVVQNNSAGVIFVGGPGVTTSNFGHKMLTGDSLVLDLERGDVPYLIAASSLVVNLLFLGVNA